MVQLMITTYQCATLRPHEPALASFVCLQSYDSAVFSKKIDDLLLLVVGCISEIVASGQLQNVHAGFTDDCC